MAANNEEKKEEEKTGTQTEVNGGGNEENSPAEDNTKTFTQEQVSRMMAKEKHQGANSVYNDLGIDPKDTKMLNMLKAFVSSQKTDEQKATEQANQQASALAAAQHKALVSEAKAEAMMSGVQSQFVDDVVTLALSRISNDEGTDLKTALGELKTKYPVWFGQSSDDGDKESDEKAKGKGGKKDKDDAGKKKVGEKGTGSSVKTSSNDNNDKNINMGERLAARRRQQANNGGRKSLWSR